MAFKGFRSLKKAPFVLLIKLSSTRKTKIEIIDLLNWNHEMTTQEWKYAGLAEQEGPKKGPQFVLIKLLSTNSKVVLEYSYNVQIIKNTAQEKNYLGPSRQEGPKLEEVLKKGPNRTLEKNKRMLSLSSVIAIINVIQVVLIF